MNAWLAIVGDTWRQSRQQVVFFIMLGLLALIAIVSIVVVKPFPQTDGSVRVGFVTQDEPSRALEGMWLDAYAMSLVGEDRAFELFDEAEAAKFDEDLRAAYDKATAVADVPLARRAVESFLYNVAGVIYLVSMLLFLAACSGYLPNMLEAGALDVVLAKPIDRFSIYFAKILGGVAFYAAAILITYVILFTGIGLRTGVWAGRVFYVMPLQIFAAALLYTIVAALGVQTRNTTLCLIVGFFFYVIGDSLLEGLRIAQAAGVLEAWPVLDRIGRTIPWLLPNFSLLKQNAISSVLAIPLMRWEPIATATAWMAIALGFGSWRFWRTDY